MAKSSADIVNAWFRERVACGEVARHTPAHNQVHAALPDLIARLDAASCHSREGGNARAPKPGKTAPKPAAAAASEEE